MQALNVINWVDQDTGYPKGGRVLGVGISIDWQDGPVDDSGGVNGAQVDEIIEAAVLRLQWLQEAADGRFACQENEATIVALRAAQRWQERRTERRKVAGVEGTNELAIGDAGLVVPDPNAAPPPRPTLSAQAVAFHQPLVGLHQWDAWVDALTPGDIEYINNNVAAAIAAKQETVDADAE